MCTTLTCGRYEAACDLMQELDVSTIEVKCATKVNHTSRITRAGFVPPITHHASHVIHSSHITLAPLRKVAASV